MVYPEGANIPNFDSKGKDRFIVPGDTIDPELVFPEK